jgi:hypothetical protein
MERGFENESSRRRSGAAANGEEVVAMDEREFWLFMKGAWGKGRVPMVSGASLEVESPGLQSAGEYMGGHAILPEGYDKIPREVIVDMGTLLLKDGVRISTKEAIMMVLAHHGSDEALRALKGYKRKTDPGLEIYAELALQECEMWNEDWHAG